LAVGWFDGSGTAAGRSGDLTVRDTATRRLVIRRFGTQRLGGPMIRRFGHSGWAGRRVCSRRDVYEFERTWPAESPNRRTVGNFDLHFIFSFDIISLQYYACTRVKTAIFSFTLGLGAPGLYVRVRITV
jgi:hypothetical protein